jgi:hypothetical protein
MPDEFKLKLTGPGINLDQTISEDVAHRVVLTAFGSYAAAPPPPPGSPSATPSVNPVTHADESLAEFVNDSGAKRGPDKITAIAHYLKKIRGQQTFTRPNIEQGFVDAGDSVPGNLPRDMKWAVKAGWIAAKPGQSGTYYVTGSGSQTVQAKFPKEALKKSRLARKNRKTKRPS